MTFINPFEELARPRLDNPQGEEVTGQFSCQERGCYNVSKEARYLDEAKILTWKCKDEHVSKIEGFHID